MMYTTGIGVMSLIISILALIIAVIATSYLIVQLNKVKSKQIDYEQELASLKEDTARATITPEEIKENERRTIGPSPTSMADARLEWMDQITVYTEELITYSSALLQASKKIIQSNLEIQKNVATTSTHKNITANVALYNTNADEFKIVLTKLRLTFYDERKNAAALSSLKKIERLINSEYETQIHSDISRHEYLSAEYDKQVAQFIDSTRKQLEEEWDKIKRGR